LFRDTSIHIVAVLLPTPPNPQEGSDCGGEAVPLSDVEGGWNSGDESDDGSDPE
jgi:hypothetical protein